MKEVVYEMIDWYGVGWLVYYGFMVFDFLVVIKILFIFEIIDIVDLKKVVNGVIILVLGLLDLVVVLEKVEMLFNGFKCS